MKKKRIVFLDAIKAVSILLVVFCHYVTLPAETIVGNGIMSLAWCAVPCFFMVTGSLLHSKKEFSVKMHIKKIIYTYFMICCWKFLYLVFGFVITEVHFSKTELINYLFLFGDIDNVDIGHIWFMYGYLLILIFFPISYYIISNDNSIIKKYTGILLFVGGIGIHTIQYWCKACSEILEIGFININALSKILPFGSYVNMLFYFFIGGIIFRHKDDVKALFRNKKILLILSIFLGVFGNMINKYTYTRSFQWQGIYLEGGYNRFSTLLMSLGLYILFLLLEDVKITEKLAKYIGEDTMGIYYLHMPILNIISIFVFPYLKPYYSVELNIVKTIVVTILCVVATKAIKSIPYFKILVK